MGLQLSLPSKYQDLRSQINTLTRLNENSNNMAIMGLQLSLVRVSACHAEGREFEPRQSRHLKRLSFIDGLFYCKKGNFLGSSRLSWICSTLTEFRFKHFVQVRSICSLSGLASVRKSARQSRHLIKQLHYGAVFLVFVRVLVGSITTIN